MARAPMFKMITVTMTAAAMIAATPAPTGTSLILQPQSRLWVDGTSTVRGFTCATTNFTAQIESESPQSIAQLMLGTKAVKTVVADFPTQGLDCKNGTMNGHMREALKADKNPTITWKMSSYKVEGTSVEISGTLEIAGKENPIVLRGTGVAENGTVTLKGTKLLKMTDYGVKPPSLMFGTMKVADAVTVSFDLVLNQ